MEMLLIEKFAGCLGLVHYCLGHCAAGVESTTCVAGQLIVRAQFRVLQFEARVASTAEVQDMQADGPKTKRCKHCGKSGHEHQIAGRNICPPWFSKPCLPILHAQEMNLQFGRPSLFSNEATIVTMPGSPGTVPSAKGTAKATRCFVMFRNISKACSPNFEQ